MEEQIIEKNPFVGLNSPRKNKPLPKVLSIQQVGKLLDTPIKMVIQILKVNLMKRGIKYAALRDAAILELLYSTGMRINELVLKLTEDNIDLISGTVIVKGKGKKERLCPLGKYAEKAIRDSIESRDNILFLSKKISTKSPLFLNKQGQGLSAGQSVIEKC